MPDPSSQPLGRFPTTQWSLVARAADLDPQVKREALARLFERYMPAFRAHLTFQRRIPAEKIDDLLQSFACDRIVNDELIARAEQSRGRLRNYLLKSLNRHVLMVRRHDDALCRSPTAPMAMIDDTAEVASGDADASSAFDVAWAKGVIAQAVEGMRQECEHPDKNRTWRVFELRTLKPLFDGVEPVAYEEIAAQCGFRSPLEAANALVTAKRMFARVLKSIVEEYADGADVELELRELRAILSNHGSNMSGAFGA